MSHRIKQFLFGSRKRKLASAVVTVALIGVGTAWAAGWLVVNNNAQGGGRIGHLTPPTVSAGTAPADSACVPGGSCDGVFEVTNDNNVDLYIISSVNNTVAAVTSNPTACPGSYIHTENQWLANPIKVPKKSSMEVRIPDAFGLIDTAPDTCQDITFTKQTQMQFNTSPTP